MKTFWDKIPSARSAALRMVMVLMVVAMIFLMAVPGVAGTSSGSAFVSGTAAGKIAVTSSGDSTTRWVSTTNCRYVTFCYDLLQVGASTLMSIQPQISVDEGVHWISLTPIDTVQTGDATGCITFNPSVGITALNATRNTPTVPVLMGRVRLLFNKTAGTATDSLRVIYQKED